MPPQLDIAGVLRPGRSLTWRAPVQQQLQPALLQHVPDRLPVLAGGLRHCLGDALRLQPVRQGLQAGGERRVGADFLAATPATLTDPGGRDADAGHHLLLADIQRRGAFHVSSTACHLLPDRLCWWRPAGPTEETTLKRVLAADSSWCREGPRIKLGHGLARTMRAELGRASPFSSLVAANGHGISDGLGSRVGRRSGYHPVYGDAWIDRGLAWVLGGARASEVPMARWPRG
jgi:hypothetical protein